VDHDAPEDMPEFALDAVGRAHRLRGHARRRIPAPLADEPVQMPAAVCEHHDPGAEELHLLAEVAARIGEAVREFLRLGQQH
jgi:hypothetical protein